MNTFDSVIVKIMADLKGCQFVGMVYARPLTLTKAQKALIGGDVTKVVDGQYQLNYGYEKAVNNRLDKQGSVADFKAFGLPYGKWYMPNKLIEHKGEYLMRYYHFDGAKMDTSYYINGKKATDAQTAYLKTIDVHKPSYTQIMAGLVSHQVEIRNISIKHIQSITIDGVTIKRN